MFPLFFAILIATTGKAQYASSEIYQDIQRLGVLANVLYVAAHPDDENTRMISYLSNHLHARTTYLSLTRGDGGQNLIGPEIREMLGLIRTHELLAAREIDGGHQMFTRANDFGYSKTARETFNIWGKDEVLSDVVWAIRQIKPDIIINRFTADTLRPNHGHHTASAILSIEAFDLAGKSNAYAGQLQYTSTWQPERIFCNTSWWFYGSREAFEKVDKSKMLTIDIGAYDPVTGMSSSEIAGRSRSMHKSQGFGSAETRGQSLEYLELIRDHKGQMPQTLFDGIDITWSRVPGGSSVKPLVEKLKSSFDFTNPSGSLPLLLQIHDAISDLPESYWKSIKLSECEDLIQKCLGLFLELKTNTFRVSPGEDSLQVTLEAINRSSTEMQLVSVKPVRTGEETQLFEQLVYNQPLIKTFYWSTPGDLSIPYWLESGAYDGLYTVENQIDRGVPDNKPAMQGEIEVVVDGRHLTFTKPVIFKTVDPAEGELTRPLYITPPVAVSVAAEAIVMPTGLSKEISIELLAIENDVTGTLHFEIDEEGWTISPGEIPFTISRSGETKTFTCIITPPNKTSSATFSPKVIIDGQTFHQKIYTLDYDHIPYMSVVRDASIKLESFDIQIVDRPIGYITGAGDEVAASLRQIGFQVDAIEPEKITASTLSGYEVIILGVRAYNTIDALAYKNQVLFDWVNKGGTLITQYNVSRGLVTEEVAPYPIRISRDRITEEDSPVTILNPEHPALNKPNAITAKDFEGWTQERGLYFPDQWDAAFEPLLEMKDSGDPPVHGGLLVAKHGEGYYVYSGLSWFRHLPAGNTGPYRLLSNLIALGHNPTGPR